MKPQAMLLLSVFVLTVMLSIPLWAVSVKKEEMKTAANGLSPPLPLRGSRRLLPISPTAKKRGYWS